MDQIEFPKQVKQRVIVALLADDELGEKFVLKGGNLLQFAYGISSRASRDVDISIDGEFEDFEWLHERVRMSLQKAFDEMGLVVFEFKFREVPAKITDDVKSFWGGYQCEFKLINRDEYESSGGNIEYMRKHAHTLDSNSTSPKFKIDFSRHEFCDDKEEFEIDGYTICGYSPRMFVAEKIRAICQQMPEYSAIVHRSRDTASRARDFVDIHVIVGQYGVAFSDPEFHEIVRKTFAKKRVPLECIGRIRDFRDHHEHDFASVRDTVSLDYELQEFDFYFDWVCRNCELLECLWNE